MVGTGTSYDSTGKVFKMFQNSDRQNVFDFVKLISSLNLNDDLTNGLATKHMVNCIAHRFESSEFI